MLVMGVRHGEYLPDTDISEINNTLCKSPIIGIFLIEVFRMVVEINIALKAEAFGTFYFA